MTYRVALIGAGAAGRAHAERWRALPGAELVGALDPDGDAARAVGGAAFSDWNTLLAQARPDIVDICTPTPSHKEYVEKAAAAGKAVFVEAPLARTLAGCDAMAAAVERAGVPAMAGHRLRFAPEYAAAKRLVDAGAAGTPAAIRLARTVAFPGGLPGPGERPNWQADPAQSGGVVLDLLGHEFDWLRAAFGPVLRVYAKGLPARADLRGRLDYALVTLRFVSGAVGHVTGSWAQSGGGACSALEIAGDGGLIEHDSARSAPLLLSLRTGSGEAAVPAGIESFAEDPCFLALAAFVSALERSQPPPVTLGDGRAAAEIALAALRSIDTGKAVTL